MLMNNIFKISFLISSLMLLSAFYLEYFHDAFPCDLCITQRWFHALIISYSLIAILTLPIAIIRPNAMWIILSLTTAFGGAIELLQPLVNRNCEMADFLANAVGTILGVLVTRALRARRRPTAD